MAVNLSRALQIGISSLGSFLFSQPLYNFPDRRADRIGKRLDLQPLFQELQILVFLAAHPYRRCDYVHRRIQCTPAVYSVSIGVLHFFHEQTRWP